MDELHFSYPLSADGSDPAISEIFRYLDEIFVNGTSKLVKEKCLRRLFWRCFLRPTMLITRNVGGFTEKFLFLRNFCKIVKSGKIGKWAKESRRFQGRTRTTATRKK
jgi:hypothetical protein